MCPLCFASVGMIVASAGTPAAALAAAVRLRQSKKQIALKLKKGNS